MARAGVIGQTASIYDQVNTRCRYTLKTAVAARTGGFGGLDFGGEYGVGYLSAIFFGDLFRWRREAEEEQKQWTDRRSKPPAVVIHITLWREAVFPDATGKSSGSTYKGYLYNVPRNRRKT